MIDEFRRLALFTSGVAELTRNRAEQIVRDMVKSGEVRRDQASGLVKTALDFSKVNRAEFMETIRAEIKNQIARAGVVSKKDVERLERRVARLEASAKKTTAKGTSKPPRKSTVKTTARKAAPRRSGGEAGGAGSGGPDPS